MTFLLPPGIKGLNLDYHELMRKIEEEGGKKYLVIHDYMLDKTLDKIKEIISIENIDDTKILIDAYDKFPDDITFKNAMTCVIKDDDKFYLETFLEEAF